MPTVRYEIRNEYGLADPELYNSADRDDPEAILEGVAMAGLVGLLRQLGDLAEFAAEIFHDLHEEVMVTASRGNAVKLRVQQLEAELPSVEKTLLTEIGHPTFSYKSGTYWHANLQIDQSLVTQGDMPRFILDSYEECRAPPKLFMLDKFDVAGAGACLKRYSDPSFFKNTLDASGAVEDMERETKILKNKKKGLRWRNSETLESLLSPHADHSSQPDITDQVPEKIPTKRVKLKHRHLAVHDISRNHMENLFNDQPPEEKLMLENSKHGSINSNIEIPEIREAVATALIIDPLFRKMSPTQSPEENEEAVLATVELEKHKVHGAEFLDTQHESKLEEPKSYSSHPIVHLEDKPAKLETTGVNIVDELISNDIEGDLSYYKEVERVKMVMDDGEESGDLSHSDVVSEMESFMDALNTMESEVETDNESRVRLGLSFAGAEYQAIKSDPNENQVLQVRFKEADNIGGYTASSVTVRKHIDTSDSEAPGKYGGSVTTEESFAVAPNMLPNLDVSSQETIDSVTGDLNQGKYTEQKPLEVYSAEAVDGSACQGLQDNGADMELRSADHRSYDGISDHQVSTDQNFMREQHANIFSESYMEENTNGNEAVDNNEVSLRCLNGNFEVSLDQDMNQLHNTDISELPSLVVMDNYRLAEAIQLVDVNAEEMTSIDAEVLPEARCLSGTYEVALDQDANQLHADISGLPSLVEMESYNLAEATQGAHFNAEETTSVDAKLILEASVQTQNSNELEVAKQPFEEQFSSSYPERKQVDISVGSAESRAPIDTETDNDLSNWQPGSLINEMENGIDIGGLAISRSVLGFKDTRDISEDEMALPKTSSFHWEHYLEAELQESGTKDLADSIEEESLLSHAHIDQQVPVIDNMISAFGSTVSGPCDEGTQRQSILLVNEKMVAGTNTDECKAHSFYAAVEESCPTIPSLSDLISHKPDVNNFDFDMKTIASISATDDGPGAHVHLNSVLQDEDLEQHNTEDAESFCQEGRLELEKQHLVDTVNLPEGNEVIFVSKTASFETSVRDSDDELLGKHLNSLSSGPAHEDSNTHKAQENEIEELHTEQNMPTRDAALECASDGNQVCVLSSLTGFRKSNVSNIDALDPHDGCEMNSHFLKEDAKVGAHLASMKPAFDLAQEDISMMSIKFFTEPVASVEEASESQTDRFSAGPIMNEHSDECNLAAIELDFLQSDTKDDDKLASTKDVHSSVDIISSSISLLKDPVHSGYEASETQAVGTGLHSLREDMHKEHLAGSDHHFETVIHTGDTVTVHNIDLPFEASEPEAQRLFCTEEVEEHQNSELDLQVLATSEISSPELDLARLETSSQASEPQSVAPVFSSPRLDETPPLPPLPPLEWRTGKLCLGSLSTYDTLETSAESNKVMVSSFLENDHSHGLLTLENENEKSAKLPMPHFEGDLIQDASKVKVVQALRLTELPPIVADKGSPDGVILPEVVDPHPPQGTVTVGEGMDMYTHSPLEQNNPLAPSLESQEENGHQLPLHGEDKQSMNSLDLPLMTMTDTNTSPLTQVHQLLASIESDNSGLSGLNSESDYPQHLNPYMSVSSAEHSQSEHDYGVDDMQLVNPLAPLPVTESLVLPSGSTPFLSDNLFTSYGVIDPVEEDERPYRRRSSILNRPRNPLIQAVASHDKSTLRKVSGMVKSKPKEGERDTLLEQIRNKSFNLKPAGVTRPSIKGPQTNLKVAAILEKANAIRQACVGSDDDEGGDWSDS